jgi:hypothetical protein
MDEGKFAVLSRRLGIMIMALIIPELIITWATCQFISARNTAKAFNHAFDAQLHQARSGYGEMGESRATLHSEILTLDTISLHPSAPHVASCNFEGLLPVWPFDVVTNFPMNVS